MIKLSLGILRGFMAVVWVWFGARTWIDHFAATPGFGAMVFLACFITAAVCVGAFDKGG